MSLIHFADIKNAIRTNQIQNYIPKHTDNNYTLYMEGNLQPSNIFPGLGFYNNINNHPNKYTPFVNPNLPVDYYNPIGTNMKISKPLFYDENIVLPDLIGVGLKNSHNARIIGTAMY